jgi:hypothetical protein
MLHELKTWPQYFAGLACGRKTFELRKNDRDFSVGDELRLKEWCPIMENYTGREEIRFVSYVLTNCAGLDSDYAVLGLDDKPF